MMPSSPWRFRSRSRPFRSMTSTHPFYSLIGDFRVYADTWMGKIPF
jgi:hypothetical protein